MPGMEIAAPERTDTSSGRSADPNRRPVPRSIVAIPSRTCAQISSAMEPRRV
ncbi:hypothetical protein [Nocardia seriolae]|uniref:Uncharacterized protein n=1 Tax=Nocardia seriolae TaxID=37332 RepID=A0ABC8B2P6_9NOCA|nr:hypothetical protein [Nocardia seriolae]APB00861.1 hypothetical protein NS506_06830 [Nocardia seriolae]BEK86094.1 hypothetical protein NSERKGN1266_20450 [Nocardia seriolae]BEK97972.1 hypothetical protein NSER024013_58780 [Nocardia seriolae]GAM45540.1 ATP-dependent DNA helicase [Nocardia seriolae]